MATSPYTASPQDGHVHSPLIPTELGISALLQSAIEGKAALPDTPSYGRGLAASRAGARDAVGDRVLESSSASSGTIPKLCYGR